MDCIPVLPEDSLVCVPFWLFGSPCGTKDDLADGFDGEGILDRSNGFVFEERLLLSLDSASGL